jgi:hypothetical protein
MAQAGFMRGGHYTWDRVLAQKILCRGIFPFYIARLTPSGA